MIDWTNGSDGLKLAKAGSSKNQGGFDFLAQDQMIAGNGNPLTLNNVDYTVNTSGNIGNNGQFWHIEYCYNYSPPNMGDRT